MMADFKQRLMRKATQMMEGDRAKAERWLNTPLRALNGKIPLQTANNETETREIERIIHCIEHGIFT